MECYFRLSFEAYVQYVSLSLSLSHSLSLALSLSLQTEEECNRLNPIDEEKCHFFFAKESFSLGTPFLL